MIPADNRPVRTELEPDEWRVLEEYRQAFDVTGDPIQLWDAYGFCRVRRVQIPEWILVAFDRIEGRLSRALTAHLGSGLMPDRGESARSHWSTAIAAAFGFKVQAGGGASDPFKRWTRSGRDRDLATRVRLLVDGKTQCTEHEAIVAVASKHDVPEKNVRTAWTKFRDVVRVRPLDEQQQQIERLDEKIRAAMNRGRAGTTH